MVGLGIDAVDVARFRNLLARRPGLSRRLFTDDERAYAARLADPAPSLAARFAAKEATMKALGVGVGAFRWCDVEVRRAEGGRPSLILRGNAAAIAGRQGVESWQVSLTHTASLAEAVVAALSLTPVLAVLTSEQMKAVDASTAEPVEVLIARAGWAVARAALALLGGTYGRRVVVVAGKGNNGADGRAAASVLESRGVRVEVIAAASLPARLAASDLVIDAAYGTGFRGHYSPPDPNGAPVLAVDIPSGFGGDTGATGDLATAVRAAATVTFAAYKPGLLLGEGPSHTGPVEVADIGLDEGVQRRVTTWLVEDSDVGRWLPARPRQSHKWQTAVAVAAGSPGMMGAPHLVGRAAMHAGAGYVRLGVPGAGLESIPEGEAVGVALPPVDWDGALLEAAARCRAVVVGPGLGGADTHRSPLLRVLAHAPVPVVVDADGINALESAATLRQAVAGRSAPVVITPHEGEYARLFGAPPGADRLAAVRQAAADTGAVVLLKGSTTVVAAPDGRALLAASGSPRLATAGTGDVLSGVIGAFVARGVPAFEAAGLAAHVHGRAAALGFAEGLVAGDLPELVAGWLSGLRR